jgi:DNA-binding transcriptional ArsR family regulator
LKKVDMMVDHKAIDTVEFAKALADETRQKIMALCCCQLLSVGDIVASLDVAQPTVSHHLKILKNAGLVRSERQGKQVLYTLNQARLAQGCCQVAEEFAPDENIRLVVAPPASRG